MSLSYRRAPAGRGGFTLMEVLVTLMVAGIVALLLHHGIGELRRLADRASAARSSAARGAAIRRQISSWLRGVYVDPFHASERFDGVRGRAGADRVTFWTGAAAWEEGGPLQVTLEVEPGAGLVAHVLGPAAPAGGEPRRILLVPGAEGFQVRYYVLVGAERRWVTGWSSAATAPAGVELRITGGRVPPLLRIPILVANGG